MDFVAVDLGASSTRYLTVGGKVNWIPNNAVFIKDMSKNLNNEKLDEIPENNLDVSIWKEGKSDIFPMRVLIGEMARRFGISNQTPSQQKLKVEQPINYMSAVVAVALSKLHNPEISNKLNLFIALPPAEVMSKRFTMREQLVGKYTVTFHKIGTNGTTIEFNIDNVACYEESRMALMQYILDENHPERLNQMMGCNVLSIDIGASTTDLAIFQSGKYLDKTGRTYRVGCNIARDYIIKAVSASTGMDMPIEDAERCLSEGRIRSGNKYKDIRDIIDEAKEAVAKDIIARMDPYFSGIDMTLSSMNYIIVSGGGSMESSYIDDNGIKQDTSRPMSGYITDALKDICEDIDVVHFGDEPRLANIRGLGNVALLKKGEIVED